MGQADGIKPESTGKPAGAAGTHVGDPDANHGTVERQTPTHKTDKNVGHRLSGDKTSRSTTHAGSAPTQLSGPRVLATWVISLAAHALLFFVMFMVPWLSHISADNELPIPNVELVGEVETASFSMSALPDFSEKASSPSTDPMKFSPDRFDRLADLAALEKPDLSIIGIGAGGGDFSKFGLKGGGDAAPSFFGQRVQGARRIVYVVDRSGSMTDTFGYVRDELKRSISKLRRSQKFHVIFFSSGMPVENPPRRLVSAIQAQKQQFFSFLDTIYSEGGTHPEPALVRAFEVDPDLVYFLTDGEFNPSLLDKLDKINRNRSVRIFTIAYFDRRGAELLEKIAREHRGEFTFVGEDDIP